ncbi:SAM-dependent methyltransferase [Xanthobacter sp. DSM 24535]|uniref:SAM-dependent methyltransferase n=1 Tax=Roseixanthobacter psychrophilus TaxID=3119917 RepID=UPI0037280C14
MSTLSSESALVGASPSDDDGIRPGEVAVALPPAFDAGLYFIGRIRTPWARREDCPKRGSEEGPICRLEIDPRWEAALEGVGREARLQVLYFMDQARRDLVLQMPRRATAASGTFALRSPVRPNPIASSVVLFVAREGMSILVRGLDCIDGTPLVDLKPQYCTLAHDVT